MDNQDEMSGSEDESLPSDQKDDGGDTFFVPEGALAGKDCSAGDKVTFEVLGKDSDGDYEVKFDSVAKGSTDDYNTDLKKTFAQKPMDTKGGY